MAENGNRGPNDFRARNGKRRREPPTIDASATEVPLDAATPLGEPASDGPAADPVLFGGARRSPEEAAAPAGDEAALVPSALDGEPAPGEPVTSTPAPDSEPRTEGAPVSAADPAVPSDPVARIPSPDPVDPTRPAAPEPEAPVPPAGPAARSGGGGAAWLLGASNLALLAALAWVLYTAPQRDRHGEVADLGTKVAALEARPDPSGIEGDVAALGRRLGSADAERADLAKTVSGLNTRLDAVAQQAWSAKAAAEGAASAADTMRSDAGKIPPAPTGSVAAATVGALAALAGRVDSIDGGVSALAADQARTAKAVADLPKPVAPDFGPVDARLASLESGLSGRMAALDTRLTALDGKVNGSDARLNDFDAKVNGVDGKVNGFDARTNAFAARTNGIEAKLNDASAGLGRLEATVADLPKADLSPLQAATAALGGEVVKIEGQLAAAKDGSRVTEARAVGSADETRATPIALVGQAVGRAVANGRPYAADLDALKALGADPDALAKLQPLAATGAPTAPALKARWDAVSSDVLAAVKPAQAGSVLDRFAAGARALVQVRQVGASPEGDDPGALVGRVDASLDGGDVAGALAAWNRLPRAGQDRSRDWAAAAEARVEAAVAAQALVGRAIATLGRTKS